MLCTNVKGAYDGYAVDYVLLVLFSNDKEPLLVNVYAI